MKREGVEGEERKIMEGKEGGWKGREKEEELFG